MKDVYCIDNNFKILAGNLNVFSRFSAKCYCKSTHKTRNTQRIKTKSVIIFIYDVVTLTTSSIYKK